MRKLLIIAITLSIPLNLIGQFEVDHFLMLENQVKSIRFSKNEHLEFKYGEGEIIEEYHLSPFDGSLEKKYHYQKIGKLDSVEVFESHSDTIYRTVKYYIYNENHNLEKTYSNEDLTKKIIRVDSFAYDNMKRMKTQLHFSNRVETIFGTKRIDSLRFCGKTDFFYDENSLKIKEISSLAYSPDSILFSYDSEKQLIIQKEFFGGKIYSCFQKEIPSIRVSETTFSYNHLGLIKSTRDEMYEINSNTPQRRIDKYTSRRRYKFYR